MNSKVARRVEEIALDLAGTLSVVDTKGEIQAAQKVYDIFSKMEYYKENPQNLYYVDAKDDVLGRKSVMAIMEGKKTSGNKTILMIGHFDSVGISDYGNLKEYANQPLKLTEKFKEIELPPAVKADLDSGDYLFGRGLFDMKAGDAIIMSIMEMISEDIENFDGNLIFAAVCDEEGNSAGMLSCVSEFVRLQNEKKYDYLALLDADYITEEYEGDPNKYIYIGTVGKVMPTFYVVGKETHVGESFKGIDPNQIAAAITTRINLNPEFSDVADGEVTLPPITLKQRDLKTEYSVQIAKSAVVFFNYATHCSTPEIILNKMVKAADECFREVIDTLNSRYKMFCEMAKREYKSLPWVARTMSFDQLCSVVRKEVPDLDEKIKAKAEALMKESIDSRDRSTKIVEFVHDMWSDKNPVVIVYFSQPYYPHIFVEGKRPKEKALLEAVEAAVKETKSDYKLGFKKFFPYISDLSYGAVPEEEGVIQTFQENLPGYGITYDLPFETIRALNLPVLDIGAFGKDAHKFTERIEKNYTFNVAPELLYRTIMNLFKK